MTREEAISKITPTVTARGLLPEVGMAIVDALIVLDLLKVESPERTHAIAVLRDLTVSVHGYAPSLEFHLRGTGAAGLSGAGAIVVIDTLLKAGFKITR